MILQEIKAIKSGRKESAEFGITVGIVLGLLGAFFFWREKDLYPYLFTFAAAFLLFGLGAPSLLKPLQKIWMTLGILLGWLMTRVILIILFYGVFTSFRMASRLLRKRFLELRWD